MKYTILLLIIITFTSCDDNDSENKINYYAECEECTVTFVYPDRPERSYQLTDESISDQFHYPTEAAIFAIEITNSTGYARAEIAFNDNVVRVNEADSIDFNVSYGIVVKPKEHR